MNMRIIYFFLASALVLSLHSCTPPDRTEYVKQIDSISNALENVAGSYEKLNLDELQNKVDTVNKHLDFIHENYKGDLLNTEVYANSYPSLVSVEKILQMA